MHYPLHLLFLCTGNSCRSIMAEGLLRHYGAGRFVAYSAGSFPMGEVHPQSLATLQRHGMDASGFRSKSWDEFTCQRIDIVITVCDNAADEVCPVFPGMQMKAHWGVPDPGHMNGAQQEIEAGFEHVFLLLEKRIKALIALPRPTAESLQKIAAL